MKRLIILILFCASIVNADDRLILAKSNPYVLGSVPVAASCADTTCTGFIYCENFETATTGYDSGKSNTEQVGTGGIVEAADTTATVLRGTQQLKIYAGNAGQDSYVYTNMAAAYDTIYVHFRLKVADATPAANSFIMQFWHSGASVRARVYLLTDGTLFIQHGDSTAGTTGTLSDDTLYHVWIRYTKSSGANDGIMSIGFGTDTNPVTTGANFISLSNGTSTDGIQYVVPYRTQQQTGYYDQILLKTTSIGQVCD